MKKRIMEYISKKLVNFSQIIEEPKIIRATLNGIPPAYVRDIFTIKKITRIKPRTIIDIGAHSGEMSKAMNYVFPNARIYSFEPVKETYEKLKEKTKNIQNITTFNLALGDSNKKCSFWMNDFSAASSLLDSEEERGRIFDVTKNKKKIIIEMKRLDQMKNIKIERPLYVKIDVEGAEKLVMKGMGNLIKQTDILHLEYNFKKLYKGQTSLNDIIKYINIAKLTSFIQLNRHFSEKWGAIYCDLIFFKREK